MCEHGQFDRVKDIRRPYNNVIYYIHNIKRYVGPIYVMYYVYIQTRVQCSGRYVGMTGMSLTETQFDDADL